MFELGTAVEADTRDAGYLEFNDQNVPLFAGWEVARRTPDGADRTVGKGLGIKASGGLGILVVPNANCVLCHCMSFRCEARPNRLMEANVLPWLLIRRCETTGMRECDGIRRAG